MPENTEIAEKADSVVATGVFEYPGDVDDESDTNVQNPTATEETPTEDASKEGEASEEAVIEPSKAESGPAGEPKRETVETATPANRDYSKFTPEETAILKTLPNRAFAKASEMLLSIKDRENALLQKQQELESTQQGNLPKSWYEHENAFILSPQFQEGSKNIAEAEQRISHWKQQLINIEKGDAWNRLGSNQPEEATIEAKLAIQEALQECYLIRNSQAEKLNALQHTFKQNYQNAATSMQQAVESRVKELNENIRPKQGQAEAAIKSLPSEFQGHPLAKVVGALYAVAQNQAAALVEAAKSVQAKQLTVADSKKAGKAVTGSKPNATTSKQIISFDELQSEFDT